MAIVATTVVYFEALRDVALARSLDNVEDERLDVLVKADQTPVNSTTHAELDRTVNDAMLSGLGRYSSDQFLAMRSNTFLVNEEPELVPLGECPCRLSGIASGPEDVPAVNPDGSVDPRGEGALIACDCRRFLFMTVPDLENSVRVFDGELPTPLSEAPPLGQPMTIDALIDVNAASVFGLQVGDTIAAEPFWDSLREEVVVRVSGIYQRSDPDDLRWHIHDSEFTDLTPNLAWARFVVPEITLLDALGPYFPNMGAEYVWLMDTDTGSIHATDTGAVRAELTAGSNTLKPVIDGFRIETELGDRLADFEAHVRGGFVDTKQVGPRPD